MLSKHSIFFEEWNTYDIKKRTWGCSPDVGPGDWRDQISSCWTRAAKSLWISPSNPEKYRLHLSKMKARTQGLMILRDVAVDFPQEWKFQDSAQKNFYTDRNCWGTTTWSHWDFSSLTRCSLLFGAKERALGSCDEAKGHSQEDMCTSKCLDYPDSLSAENDHETVLVNNV